MPLWLNIALCAEELVHFTSLSAIAIRKVFSQQI